MTDTIRMPCLTLWQPWAALVAAGLKTIENRPWAPPMTIRGKRIAIHAGKYYDNDGWPLLAEAVESLRQSGPLGRHLLDVRGAILATAQVVGMVTPLDGGDPSHTWFVHDRTLAIPRSFENQHDWWMCDQIGWLLHDIRLLPEPIPAKGHQGIWYVDLPIAAVEAA